MLRGICLKPKDIGMINVLVIWTSKLVDERFINSIDIAFETIETAGG